MSPDPPRVGGLPKRSTRRAIGGRCNEYSKTSDSKSGVGPIDLSVDALSVSRSVRTFGDLTTAFEFVGVWVE
jgi:hypothetical protein